MKIAAIKGFNDILPHEVWKWQLVEEVARRLFANFGFQELRIPILEKTELFARSIGESTDIVEKEMYTFADRNGQLLTLRPEATASVIRAFIQHRLHLQAAAAKYYTIGPMFRHERPQKGRYRQFHQINVEAFGIEAALIDAEVIYMLLSYLEELQISSVKLHLNSLGCPGCRQPFRQALAAYLAAVDQELCTDCRRRRHTNPLRFFDCKAAGCGGLVAEAPKLLDYLCPDCERHLAEVQGHLRALGVEFNLDPYMVRGLDYYTRTTFEVITEHLGAQNAVGGGGRYDGLMKALGGPDLPGIGFAIGMERLIMLLGSERQASAPRKMLFVAALGAEAVALGFRYAQELRRRGIGVEMDYEGRSLKAQMRRADKLGASHVLILGEEELAQGKAILRDMGTQQQRQVELGALLELIGDEFGDHSEGCQLARGRRMVDGHR